MRLLYTSDLHGSDGHYAKLLDAAESIKPDVVVLGGDLLPDDSAMHPQTLGHGQPEYVRTQFRKIITELRQRSGCREVLVIFGNHDWGSSVPAMEELQADSLVSILVPGQSLDLEGLRFVGYSCTPPTPWFVKDFERLDMPGDRPPLLGGARWDSRFSRPVQHGAKLLFDGLPTMSEELEKLTVPQAPWVFVCHAPPYETNLDRPSQDDAWGSKAVRASIEKNQPLLSLHGHIHQSPKVSGQWKDMIGQTTAVNPGQTTQRLCYAVIEVDVAAGKITHLEHGQQA